MDKKGIHGKPRSRALLTSMAVGSVLLVAAMQSAFAATATTYGASVYLDAGSASSSDGGWGSAAAGDTLNTLYGNASASAGFYGPSPLVSATANSEGFNPGYARAIAGVEDSLIFGGSANGSSSDVTVHIAGNWSISLNPAIDNRGSAPWVRFSVGLTRSGMPMNTYDSWRSLVSGSVRSSQSYLDTVVTGSWTEFTDSNAWSAAGTYAFDFRTRVYLGWNYLLGLAITAEAPSGARAFIDDPLVIETPAGTTFTASSISRYSGVSAVPVPPAGLLLGSAIFGLAGALRRS